MLTLDDLKQIGEYFKAKYNSLTDENLPLDIPTPRKVINMRQKEFGQEDGDEMVGSLVAVVLAEASYRGDREIEDRIIDMAEEIPGQQIVLSEEDERSKTRNIDFKKIWDSGKNTWNIVRQMLRSIRWRQFPDPQDLFNEYPIGGLVLNRIFRSYFLKYRRGGRYRFDDLLGYGVEEFGVFWGARLGLDNYDSTSQGIKGDNAQQLQWQNGYVAGYVSQRSPRAPKAAVPRAIKPVAPEQEEEDDELTSSRVLAFMAEPYRKQIEALKRKAIK